MKQYSIIIIILLFILNVWLYPKKEPSIHEDTTAPLPTYFEVEISGAVVFPGKYRFFVPTTLNQVIHYAGGLLPNANLLDVYLTEKIDRHQQIHIKTEIEEISPIIEKVNINQASFKQLLEIPFMTETRAASLIVYREANGPFLHIEALLNVKHIGPVTLENIKPYIKLN
jgi:competence protein ComEA